MKLIEKMAEEYAKSCHNPMSTYYDIACENTKKTYVAGNLNLLKIAEEYVQKDPESAPICGCVRSLLEFLNNYCGKGRGE